MTSPRRRELVAALPCQWCYVVGHDGNCRSVWGKLAAEQAAQGLQLRVPRNAVCPWCRRCVISHSFDCPAARMVEVAP